MSKQDEIREAISDIILDNVDEDGHFDSHEISNKILCYLHYQGVVIKKYKGDEYGITVGTTNSTKDGARISEHYVAIEPLIEEYK